MFDLDNDGFLTVPDLRRIMTSLGDDKLSKRDLERIKMDWLIIKVTISFLFVCFIQRKLQNFGHFFVLVMSKRTVNEKNKKQSVINEAKNKTRYNSVKYFF